MTDWDDKKINDAIDFHYRQGQISVAFPFFLLGMGFMLFIQLIIGLFK